MIEQSSQTKTNASVIHPTENVVEKSFDLKLTSSWLNDYAHIGIESGESIGIRAACDLCCVIDTSGSMSTEVSIH